jgi:hypothetical protein
MANNRSYIFYMFAFGLVVPFLVIVVSYVSILRVVKKVTRPAVIDEKHVLRYLVCECVLPRQIEHRTVEWRQLTALLICNCKPL